MASPATPEPPPVPKPSLSAAAPEPPPVPAAGPCCAQTDVATMKPCSLCGKMICKNCRSFVNGKQCCETCVAQIKSELAAERGGVANLPLAACMGIAAAFISGAIWAAIIVWTNMQIGYVAIGVGWLAGQGVFIGSGKKRGTLLQVMAVGCAILGLLLGKYFWVASIIHDIALKNGQELGYFDLKTILAFVQLFPKTLDFFDILWVLFALGTAWSIPKASDVHVR